MHNRNTIGDIGENAVIKLLVSPPHLYHACTLPYRGRNGIDVVAWRRGRGAVGQWDDTPDVVRFIEVKSTSGSFDANHQPTYSDYQKQGGHRFVANRLTASLHYSAERKNAHKTDASKSPFKTKVYRSCGSACNGTFDVEDIDRATLVEKLIDWLDQAWFEEEDGKPRQLLNQAEIDALLEAGGNAADVDPYRADKRTIRARFEIAKVENVNTSTGAVGPITTNINWTKF
ncbi:MAG: hypothetical protein AAFR65_07975 [Pseudomonadota bacterium]